MRWIARMLSAALLAAAVTAAAGVGVPGIASAASNPDDEAVFVTKINELRASLGLAPLTPDPALAATSCVWNDQLIVNNALSHDPNLSAAIASVEPNWRKGGENVGMGGTVVSLFDAFVASPGHYQNLVDPAYSRVGVCASRSASGKLFTTHRFLGVATAAPAPAPPPPTTAPPATPAPTNPPPAPTAPPTTAAPTTAAPTTAAVTPQPAPTTAAAPISPTPAPTPASSGSPISTAATASAALGSAPSSDPAGSAPDPTSAADPAQVRALVTEILAGFPEFLHLRLP